VRRALFQIHLWIGIGIGLYILVICVSGSLIVFRRELDRALCPRVIMVPNLGRRLTDAQLEAKARAAYPRLDYKQVQIQTARAPGMAVEVWFVGGTFRIERLFNPYTGANLNDTVACEPRFVTWIADLHDNLTRGRFGLRLNGVGAILVVVMGLSGLVLWWPGRRRWRHSITLHRNVNGRRFIRELHSVAGIWLFLLIILWTVTGIYFAFPAPFNALTEAFTAHGLETTASLRVEDAISWLVRLHFGRSFGVWIEVAWALLGLVPCGLLITGLLMWWHRVVRPTLTDPAHRSTAPHQRIEVDSAA
jgi:uncharacterized iron-regulated membrane protein